MVKKRKKGKSLCRRRATVNFLDKIANHSPKKKGREKRGQIEKRAGVAPYINYQNGKGQLWGGNCQHENILEKEKGEARPGAEPPAWAFAQPQLRRELGKTNNRQ